MDATDLTPETTPSLASLETAVCEAMRRHVPEGGPFAKRLDRGSVPFEQCAAALAFDLGERYAFATLTEFHIYDKAQQPIIDRLTDFAQNMPTILTDSPQLVFYGPPGTGKDHLLAALLKIALYRHRLTVRWFDGGELFDAFYVALKADDGAELVKLHKELHRPQILAISDPQPPSGNLSESQVRRFRDLVDARYRRGLATWLTTNVDSAKMAAGIFTRPVWERLRESAAVIECDWPSYRESRKD